MLKTNFALKQNNAFCPFFDDEKINKVEDLPVSRHEEFPTLLIFSLQKRGQKRCF